MTADPRGGTRGGPPRRPYGHWLGFILSAGFLLRAGIFVWIPTQPQSDFLGYFLRAESISSVGRDEIRPGRIDTSHPPAYPLVLSAALAVAPRSGHLLAAKAANAGLAVLAAAIGALLARGLWGDAAGLWTAALLSFFPRSLLMADLVASENLFTPLLLLFLLLAARSWTGAASWRLAAAGGAVIGLLTLTRGVAYLLPVVWLAGALAAGFRPRRAAAELLLLVALEHAVLVPWAIHNARTIGRFTFLPTVGGVGLFIGNNPNATGEWREWAEDLERRRPGVGAQGPLAVDDAARQEALRWIRDNPGRAAVLYLRKLRIILTDDGFVAGFTVFFEGRSSSNSPIEVLPGPHLLKAHPRAVRRALRVAGILLAVAALGGFVVLVRAARAGSAAARSLAVGFAAAALYIPLVSAAIAVNGRYRWPVEDAVMPLAGLWLARKTRSGRKTTSGSWIAAEGLRGHPIQCLCFRRTAWKWKRSASFSSSRSPAWSATSPGRS